jgi:hypothetical protein
VTIRLRFNGSWVFIAGVAIDTKPYVRLRRTGKLELRESFQSRTIIIVHCKFSRIFIYLVYASEARRLLANQICKRGSVRWPREIIRNGTIPRKDFMLLLYIIVRVMQLSNELQPITGIILSTLASATFEAFDHLLVAR